MKDKQFLELKNQIIEVYVMCSDVNNHVSELKEHILEIYRSLSELESDVNKSKSNKNA